MTPVEVRLWKRLKVMRAEGFHFRRQAPFRGYFLDFVCFSRRVVIELDGSQHGEGLQEAHDAVRDAVLKREGFRVLRFWNRQARENMDGVIHNIRLALGADVLEWRPAPPPVRASPGHPPHEGEGEPG
ncbi:MAG: endonuclease domain-containing protein [Caulobacter sp.]